MVLLQIRIPATLTIDIVIDEKIVNYVSKASWYLSVIETIIVSTT